MLESINFHLLHYIDTNVMFHAARELPVPYFHQTY